MNVQITDELSIIQPKESYSINLKIDIKEKLVYCEERWGTRPTEMVLFVKRLMDMNMIQPSITDSNKIDVNVVVWDIGYGELYIETYHQNLTDEEERMCEHDRVELYSDFCKGLVGTLVM